MRVHFFDPQLGAADGHYAAYDLAVVRELERRGIEVFVYGTAQSLGRADPGALSAKPVFRRQIFEEVGRDPATWPIENFAVINEDFHQDLASLGHELFASADIAFFPNIVQNQIDGVRKWVLGLPEGRRPSVVLKPSYLTHLLPSMQGRPNKDLIGVLFRFAVQRLVADHPRTLLCTDTERLVEMLERITGVRATLLPLPMAIEADSSPPDRAEGINCAYLGYGASEKGLHLLPAVIAQLLASPTPLRFTVQFFGEARFCAEVDQALRDVGQGRVTIVQGATSQEDYLRLLREADIVLQPYAREMYAWASSGIFVEAASLGKVMVVPEGSWMAQEARRFGCGVTAFGEQTIDAIAGAVAAAAANYSALAERARVAAPQCRAFHNPKTYADILLAAAR